MRIPLTKGYFTEVDEVDYHYLNKWKWQYGANGYAVRDEYLGKVDGKYKHKTVLMHRQLLSPSKGFDVDHINRNKLDNRRTNLRVATRSQNKANTGPRKRLNTELPTGITYNSSQRTKQPYMARICHQGKSQFLGNFYRVEDAEKAYLARKKELFGEFA